MPRTRRRIESLQMYELCFRARKSLPLPAYKIINKIIEHAVARTQRDDKLYLCHDIWNGSHPHIIVFSKDAYEMTKFYGEVQKKITDCLKRLLGISHLEIWEGRPMVAKILDFDKAVERIVYLYANPAQDDLETCIERFPGLSSVEQFLGSLEKPVAYETSKEVLRLRLPTFPVLTSFTPSYSQARGAIKLLEKRNKEAQLLKRHPNMWMRAFGIRDEQVKEINEDILKRLRFRERMLEEIRKREGRSVMGRDKLMSQAILKPHTPKKKRNKKPFLLSSCNKTRVQELLAFEHFCKECRRCYEQWLLGNFFVTWPPGAFKPPLPPNMNILPCPV